MDYESFCKMVDECSQAVEPNARVASEPQFSNGLSDHLRTYLLSLEDDEVRRIEINKVASEMVETLKAVGVVS